MAIVELNQKNFDETIEKHKIVLVDFWAPWCQPCLQFGEIYEAVSKKHPDCYFSKVNVDIEIELARDFGVRSIPTLLVICDSTVVYSGSGTMPATVLEDLIEQAKGL